MVEICDEKEIENKPICDKIWTSEGQLLSLNNF
jgi:hypothetical protein